MKAAPPPKKKEYSFLADMSKFFFGGEKFMKFNENKIIFV